MKFKSLGYYFCLIFSLSGCSSNPLINSFNLPAGTGAQLNCSWNGKLNNGQVNLFKNYNDVELKHGPNVAGKNAKYRVPSGNANIQVQINWLVTMLGPIRQAKAEFNFNLQDGQSYDIEAIRDKKEVVVRLLNSRGIAVTEPVVASFNGSVPVIVVVP